MNILKLQCSLKYQAKFLRYTVFIDCRAKRELTYDTTRHRENIDSKSNVVAKIEISTFREP